MPIMYSDTDLRLGYGVGGIIQFLPGVPRDVPDNAVAAATAAGCKVVSIAQVPTPSEDGLEPALAEAVKNGLYEAVSLVLKENNPDDFRKIGAFRGSPKLAALKRHLPEDAKPSAAEVYNVYTKVLLDTGRLAFPDGETFDGTLSVPTIDGLPVVGGVIDQTKTVLAVEAKVNGRLTRLAQ